MKTVHIVFHDDPDHAQVRIEAYAQEEKAKQRLIDIFLEDPEIPDQHREHVRSTLPFGDIHAAFEIMEMYYTKATGMGDKEERYWYETTQVQ